MSAVGQERGPGRRFPSWWLARSGFGALVSLITAALPAKEPESEYFESKLRPMIAEW